jgi:hypothetical protein
MDDGFTSECQAQFLLVHLDATTLDDALARW